MGNAIDSASQVAACGAKASAGGVDPNDLLPGNVVDWITQSTSFIAIYFVIYGIISEFTDEGQFQYLINLKGPQEGTYLYTTQFLSLR